MQVLMEDVGVLMEDVGQWFYSVGEYVNKRTTRPTQQHSDIIFTWQFLKEKGKVAFILFCCGGECLSAPAGDAAVLRARRMRNRPAQGIARHEPAQGRLH